MSSPIPACDKPIDYLRREHRRLEKAFHDFERLDPERERAAMVALVAQTCTALDRLARLECELFYPALRAALWEEDRLDEAEIEHATFRLLIAGLRRMSPDHVKYAATFRVLGRYVGQHIRAQESHLFQPLREGGLDWRELLQTLRRQLGEDAPEPVQA
ncbi:hemerythrin domain-containing protein [Chitinimonas lacunae]|uniref:Hemerythrin domain-containing protein n=1 Tax=Chitinimonas lacunae TaxID=1963018 RepID=A0ABV8MJT9_9NEIS